MLEWSDDGCSEQVPQRQSALTLSSRARNSPTDARVPLSIIPETGSNACLQAFLFDVWIASPFMLESVRGLSMHQLFNHWTRVQLKSIILNAMSWPSKTIHHNMSVDYTVPLLLLFEVLFGADGVKNHPPDTSSQLTRHLRQFIMISSRMVPLKRTWITNLVQ